MVGEVVDFQVSENARPLVFSQGTYAQASQHVETVNTDAPEIDSQQDFLNDHLPYLLRFAYNRVSRALYQRLNDTTGVSPEQWRAYASLSDGKAMALEVLAKIVMQPQYVLRDTLASMGTDNVQLTDSSAQLTSQGLALANQLLTLAKQFESELSQQLTNDGMAELKDNLQKFC